MAAVSIIGLGAVSAAGMGVDASYRAAASGANGLAPLSLFDCGLKEPPLCAQCSQDLQALPGEPVAHRTLACALLASREACRPLRNGTNLRMGLVCATTVAGITRSELFLKAYLADPSLASRASTEVAHHEPTALSGELAGRLGVHGFHSLSTACSTGLHAIGMAKRLVERGEYDVCLAVGADALSILTVRGFGSLTLLAPGGCRPFDKRRAGISLGEGAGAVLLASDRAAQGLGATVLGYAEGWGASSDCHHMTAPHPEGAGARQAIEAALADADVAPADIGFVAAHGTGTPDNDISEVKALRSVFGTPPPFCSMKRTFGHTLAASGTLETVVLIRALREGTVLPTAGFEQPDEAIGASPAPAGKKVIRRALKNAFGFGGNNAAMVFAGVGNGGKAEDPEK